MVGALAKWASTTIMDNHPASLRLLNDRAAAGNVVVGGCGGSFLRQKDASATKTLVRPMESTVQS